RGAVARRRDEILAGARLLLAAKAWGQAHMAEIAALAAGRGALDEAGMRSYFEGLVYDLGAEELAGLTLFYKKLAAAGVIPSVPELEFLPLD
ncbi:MAG: MqnA/MqnD/SBP family protein, partial [Humidesulfovibrio sp.]|nr:MqnA/MqnD/SBP family protein [Humidesulfovibrio sp.]